MNIKVQAFIPGGGGAPTMTMNLFRYRLTRISGVPLGATGTIVG